MFKVRDWVTSDTNTIPVQIVQIVEDKIFIDKNDCRMWVGESCKLWYPKVGEYCWFWNKGASKPTIGQFESKHTKSSYNMKNSIYYYDYCEPFIGTLPSLIKDK